MPYADPAKKQEYDKNRRVELGDPLRAYARHYAATHKEQRRAYDLLRRQAHAARISAQRKDYYRRNRPRLLEDMRRDGLRRRYGLTPEDLKALIAGQQGRCPICGEELPARPHVDHDHVTGKVRAVLCPRCNKGLTWVENADFREKALLYLRAHNHD